MEEEDGEEAGEGEEKGEKVKISMQKPAVLRMKLSKFSVSKKIIIKDFISHSCILLKPFFVYLCYSTIPGTVFAHFNPLKSFKT